LWTFHLKKIIEDWAYQANVLWYFVDIRTKQLDYNPYKLSKFRDCLLEEVKNKLNEYINSELLKYLPINKLSITYLKSTWDRLFDLELHIELE
jgi:hypothetical protein